MLRLRMVSEHLLPQAAPRLAMVAGEEWALVFEQRQDLSTVSGSEPAVAAAVARGADLRLFMQTQDDTDRVVGFSRSPAYEETLYFPQTYATAAAVATSPLRSIRSSSRSSSRSRSYFAGIMPHHTSTTHEGSIADQPYYSLFRYDASGAYSHIKWFGNGAAIDQTQEYPYKVYRWFVQDKYKVQFEHVRRLALLFCGCRSYNCMAVPCFDSGLCRGCGAAARVPGRARACSAGQSRTFEGECAVRQNH